MNNNANNESQNMESQINKDECVKLLEEYGNYNHDDGAANSERVFCFA
jgi:hypothetical protein